MRRPSPATLIASVALFFSLAGGAVASSELQPATQTATARTTVTSGTYAKLTAWCPAGQQATNGAFFNWAQVSTSWPTANKAGTRYGWEVKGHVNPGNPFIAVRAFCS